MHRIVVLALLLIGLMPCTANAQYIWNGAGTVLVQLSGSGQGCTSGGAYFTLLRRTTGGQDIPYLFQYSCSNNSFTRRDNGGPENVITAQEYTDAATAVGYTFCPTFLNAGCGYPPPPCPGYDGGQVGQNCCSNGLFGATYYVATDGDGCEYLACNSGSCHGCGDPPSPGEGQSCSCGEGQGNGVTSFTYDGNGCPNGTFCDDCQPCPELSGGDLEQVGRECQTETASGHFEIVDGPDGCPTLDCVSDPDPCLADSNRDGVYDYLEGNPYGPMLSMGEGYACVCEDDREGKLHIENNEDGCPVPSCVCEEDECKDAGGDTDGDGCCDDEDPDPNDSEVNCDDCNMKIKEKMQEIVQTFRYAVALPYAGGTESQWDFEIDLMSTSDSPLIRPFGIKFGGDLTEGRLWVGQESAGSVNDDVLARLFEWRSTVRGVIAGGVYLLFAMQCLFALFDPSR
ncbi:hypothetical protein SH661x_001626 [Planctomicrobium sp. SH661]|uniref:hypothetical protein n=1 Tax=Planctomicrobium sp. SH661 TaxID=3448124 RepID=UPI003F5C0D36